MAGFDTNPTSLPSTTLSLGDIRDLENQLYELLHNHSVTITISREGTDHEYASFEKLVSDSLLPSIVRSFEIEFTSQGGSGRIAADSTREDDCLLYLDGYAEWCVILKPHIKKFMVSRSNSIRSRLSGRYLMSPVSVISSILAGHYFITLSPLDVFYPSPSRIPFLYFALAIFTTLFLSSTFRHHLFPYSYLETREPKKSHRYYRSVIYVISLSGIILFTLMMLNQFA
jgi:hypothetical protein